MRLLIVEDDRKTAEYLRQGLSENGFVLDAAADCSSAMQNCMLGICLSTHATEQNLLLRAYGLVCRLARVSSAYWIPALDCHDCAGSRGRHHAAPVLRRISGGRTGNRR